MYAPLRATAVAVGPVETSLLEVPNCLAGPSAPQCAGRPFQFAGSLAHPAAARSAAGKRRQREALPAYSPSVAWRPSRTAV